jgi:hypothetical protein
MDAVVLGNGVVAEIAVLKNELARGAAEIKRLQHHIIACCPWSERAWHRDH